jgi:hypothetical protein
MIESQFIKETGQDIKGIFGMSWRKFRILLVSMFDVKTSDLDDIDDEFDWQAALDRAQGREPPTQRNEMSLDEFVGQM